MKKIILNEYQKREIRDIYFESKRSGNDKEQIIEDIKKK